MPPQQNLTHGISCCSMRPTTAMGPDRHPIRVHSTHGYTAGTIRPRQTRLTPMDGCSILRATTTILWSQPWPAGRQTGNAILRGRPQHTASHRIRRNAAWLVRRDPLRFSLQFQIGEFLKDQTRVGQVSSASCRDAGGLIDEHTARIGSIVSKMEQISAHDWRDFCLGNVAVPRLPL